MGKVLSIIELRSIWKKSFVVNRFATNDTSVLDDSGGCFIIEWSSTKFMKLFRFKMFYLYGIAW